MTANVDAMVREGVAAYKSGRKEEARALLMKAVELDQYSEEGWLWLSAVVESTEDQRTCLENVLAINPSNERARQGIETLNGGSATTPFASTPPTPAPVPVPAPTPAATPTSVEWDMGDLPTSSPSASYRNVPEPSEEEYDNWLVNLNLPTASVSDQPAPAPFEAANLFTDDEDLFSDGPFSAEPLDEVLVAPPQPAPAPRPAEPVRSPDPAPQRSAPPVEELLDSGIFTLETDDFTDEDLGDMNAEELFRYIPAEIKATRLPGTIERHPPIVSIGMFLLVILNIAAATLFVYQWLTT